MPPKRRSSRPRRILFFDHTAKLGGGELSLLSMVTRLDRRRFEPVVVLAAEGPLVELFRAGGINAQVLPMSSKLCDIRKDSLGPSSLLKVRVLAEGLACAIRLASLIRSREAELVHTNSLKADIIGGLAARIAGRPLVWHVRDRIAEDYLPRPIANVFRALCRVWPDYVVVNSRATLRSLQSADHRPTKGSSSDNNAHYRMRVVHDGTKLPEIDHTDSPSTEPLIGLVGRITPWKGQDVFLRAAAKVLKSFPNARFQIIGAPLFSEQDYENELKIIARRLGIENRVDFTGFRSDVSAVISRLDVLVHASTVGEPFGQVVIEGMAAAKPVVATGGGGVLEIVQDGITGLLVPMKDHDSMADAIAWLLTHPQKARLMGANGRQRVSDKFTIERTVCAMQDVFDTMLQPPWPPPTIELSNN
ncbi:MAG: glycosyltransferase family 4 protein [Tepidisphaeraceae bacterium]|jgi:glycosyltransferase involved in cell wall biosynthesis